MDLSTPEDPSPPQKQVGGGGEHPRQGSHSRTVCLPARALRRRRRGSGVWIAGEGYCREIRSGRLPNRDDRATLSPEKIKVTAMTEGFGFLGFRFSAHWDKRYGYGPHVRIAKVKAADLRHKFKQLTQRDRISVSLGEKLRGMNAITSGWTNFYRYCVDASRVFVDLDWYTGQRLYCWLRKKRPKATPSEPWGSKQPSRRRATRRVWR